MEKEEKKWYVVNTYSGHENKVKEKLEMRAQSMGMDDYILRVIIPEQKEIEVKDGVTKEKVKKLFPGYIIVEMIMSDEAWFVVRNTPGVTGFIGSSGKGAKPIPLQQYEVDNILKNTTETPVVVDKALEVGSKVRIISGPFTSMYGVVKEIDLDSEKLELNVDLFGQETMVEVEMSQVEMS